MTRPADLSRRTFIQTSGMALAAGFAQTPARSTERSVQTPVLNIGYAESGNASGFPIVLLHGFPDDVHAYDDVAPPLASAGFRVLVPYLRGYGRTSFRDPQAPRMAEQAAIGQDLIDFADALKLQQFAVAGYDWGGRAAGVAAALHPDRVRAAVLISGYSIQDVFSEPRPAAPQVEAAFWYQWYFNTERGRAGLAQNRRALCKLLWQQWSPTWRFTDATYDLTAPSFDNPDFVDCVIHSYRHRNQNAKGEPRFEEIERRLAARPKIDVPTITLYGADDALARPGPSDAGDRAVFTKLVGRRVIPGAGHFLPREAPRAVASALLQLLQA
jgi:pimeloyl-ACP methyl ester carboxylesterase